MNAKPGRFFMLSLVLHLFNVNYASQCFSLNFSASFQGPLYPLTPYGLGGHFSGLWSNHSNNKNIDNELSFQVWLISYDSVTSNSFYLSLLAIRNPLQLWDLVNPLILWIANRDRPVNHKTARLQFGLDGNLKLLDNGTVAWETYTADEGVTSMCIVEDAGIVLRNSEGHTVWQSTDEPTDTLQIQTAFTPGSKLVSRISAKNFSSGPYSLVMEDKRLALYFSSQPYWIFSFFPGENGTQSSEKIYSVFCYMQTINSTAVTLDLRTNWSQVNDVNVVELDSCANPSSEDRRMQLTVEGASVTYATFIRLTDLGDLVLYSWNDEEKRWTAYFSFSSLFTCFLPNQCGEYRVCNRSTNTCSQSCPNTNAFIPETEGCKLEAAESCSFEDDMFIEVPGSDYFPNKFVPPQILPAKDCLESCKLNCSCKAVFYKDNTCFRTHADVQSLITGSYTALLRVANPRKAEETNERKALAASLGTLIPALALLGGCLAWRLRVTPDENLEEDEEILRELSSRTSMPKRYTYRQLQEITESFTRRLGDGAFGTVYVGKLADGRQVAVKKLEAAAASSQRGRDFYAEVAILAKTHHWNLVKLLGFCAEGPSRRLLMYEYVVHGSLERWIFQPGVLSWGVRFDIALGTARGLSYLHEQCDERIVHLDLKPENVLLQMTTMRGTPGYVAPEILQEGTVTEKSDVYSFGVLLLEIISGYRNKSLPNFYLNFEQLEISHSPDETRVREIALLCVQDDPDARPSMSKVMQMMEGLVELPDAPSPKQLHFFLSIRSSKVQTISHEAFSTTSRSKDTGNTSCTCFIRAKLHRFCQLRRTSRLHGLSKSTFPGQLLVNVIK